MIRFLYFPNLGKVSRAQLPFNGQAIDGLPAATEEEVMKKQSKFPPGWDEERVHRVLAHYED